MTAYYNEFDPFAAEWLRQLIKAGMIAPGVVDSRSIVDVEPAELLQYTQCHFFAGIGVWSYALRLAGWPDDRPIWTGSCPCQPFSGAGQGGGFDDERHLWPHFHWLIENCRPTVVIGEQVASKDGLAWIDLVQADLEGSSYTSGAIDSCAAGVGAPHQRQRLYWMAYSDDFQSRNGGRFYCPPDERVWPEFGRCGAVSDMADSGSALSERGRIQRSGQSDEASDGSTCERSEGLRSVDDMVYPECAGLEGLRGHGDGVDQRRRLDPQSDRSATAASAVGSMAYTDGRDASAEGIQRSRQYGLEPANGRVGEGSDGAGPLNGFWRDADWLFCRDEQWRAVEPGTFPLANGIADRVGLLRGYGNAINAYQAKVFIETVDEILEELA